MVGSQLSSFCASVMSGLLCHVLVDAVRCLPVTVRAKQLRPSARREPEHLMPLPDRSTACADGLLLGQSLSTLLIRTVAEPITFVIAVSRIVLWADDLM